MSTGMYRDDLERQATLWARTGKASWPKLIPDTTTAPLAGWADRAACHGEWSTFDELPAGTGHRARAEQLARAQHICARCPVFDQCDEYADTARPRVSGVWAGRRRFANPNPTNSTRDRNTA